MGIIANVKQKLTNMASEKVTSAAALTPKQLAAVEEKRLAYLAQKPDMSSEEVKDCIVRNLGAVGIEVYQAYLEQLKGFYTPVHMDVSCFDVLNRIRYFDITKWVTDTEEKSLDKLVNVYQVLNEEDCNIALIYNRTKEKCVVTLGVVNIDEEQGDPAKATAYHDRLISALRGNFPGVEIRKNQGRKDHFGRGIPGSLLSAADVQDGGSVSSVAVVSNLASEKSEGFISQSMEKLLDGMVPQDKTEEYTIVLLAKPVQNQLSYKSRLFELYSALSPYASWQTNYTFTQSDSVGSSANLGVNLGVSAGAQASAAMSEGQNRQRLYKEDEKDGVGKKVGKKVVGMVANLAGCYSPIQDTASETTTMGANIGVNFGVSFSRSASVTAQLGSNEGITQFYTNYGVQHTLEILETQIKRLEESSSLGMWEFAAYVISEDPVMANNVAHMYMALTQGEESYMTKAALTLWDGLGESEERASAQTMLEYIQRLQHPLFGLNCYEDDKRLMYPPLVTPAANLSGKELAKSLNFPRKSISGLPVLESTAFGREGRKYAEADLNCRQDIYIGQIYHMRRKEESPVCLDTDSLTSHTFITGSTGAGKSNVVYQLISKFREQGVNFLVVEPSKGEYKKVFGKVCHVYGTNEDKAELLCINPFSFPEGIHVLEHIDRLIEIFNACWPMYAAMPAVLKDAVEKSYEKVGWDLRTSKCEPMAFPTFIDLMEVLPQVMKSSLYSEDTKSDYSGALITRVQSLTNGINGQILCSSREQGNEALFKENVIIDLSRIGSSETKSLMMGFIVMKLQEYRMSLDAMNEHLLHVTVLEEAHNLLRKTSMVQSQEGANLQGKAVEMLTNSIAEMRTYGEGFIVADQAPALLDEAVIRNTNTKIVLRLPDEADRQLVGRSLALNDDQITELARLPRGVAAVYQNDWVEAVLCKFEKYGDFQPAEYVRKDNSEVFLHYFKKVFGIADSYEMCQEDVDVVKDWIHRLRDMPRTGMLLQNVLEGKSLLPLERQYIAYNVFDGQKIGQLPETGAKRRDRVMSKIRAGWGIEDEVLLETIQQTITQAIAQIVREQTSEQALQELKWVRGDRP